MTEVIDNYTTTRNKIFSNGLGATKGQSGDVSMMLKTGMEVAQGYTVFNYGRPRAQKDTKYKDRTIVAGPGAHLAPKMVLSRNSKDKFGKDPPIKPKMR